MSVICRIFGHNEEYTDEYANADGHVQADEVCMRCGKLRIVWVGPTVEDIEEACDTTVPSKEEVYGRL